MNREENKKELARLLQDMGGYVEKFDKETMLTIMDMTAPGLRLLATEDEEDILEALKKWFKATRDLLEVAL